MVRQIALILALLNTIPSGLFAQIIYPTGSYLQFARAGSPMNQFFDVSAYVAFRAADAYPDSVYVQCGNGSNLFAQVYSNTINSDSTRLVTYTCRCKYVTDGVFEVVAQLPPEFHGWPKTMDTLAYRVSGVLFLNPSSYVETTPQFLLSAIDIKPGEKFRGNLWTDLASKDSIRFLSVSDRDHIYQYPLGPYKLHPNTGNMMLQVSAEPYRENYTMLVRTGNQVNQSIWLNYTLTVDTAIKGEFRFDTLHLDQTGMVTLQGKPHDTVNFSLVYTDRDADTLIPYFFFPANRFTAGTQHVSYLFHPDSVLVNFSMILNDDIYKHLPVPFNLVFQSKKAGRRTFNRLFSFYVKRIDDYTGIEQHNPVSLAELRVYPNPASKQLHIESPDGKRIESVFIYDLTGKEIWHNLAETDLSRIDLPDLPPQLYLIKINAGDKLNLYKIQVY